MFLQNRRKTSIFVPRFKIISNRYRNDKTFFLKLSSSHGGETLENKCKEFLSRPTVRVHTRATFKEWKGKRRSPAPSLVPRLRTEDNKFIFNLSDSRLIYQRRPSVDRGAHLRWEEAARYRSARSPDRSFFSRQKPHCESHRARGPNTGPNNEWDEEREIGKLKRPRARKRGWNCAHRILVAPAFELWSQRSIIVD